MNKPTLFYLASLVLLASCGGGNAGQSGKPAKGELKTAISQADDSLKIYYGNIMSGKTEKIPESAIVTAIDAHLDYYHYYPEDDYSAQCLDKVHQLYMQQKLYAKAVGICDTLIVKYPGYPARHEVLLDAASTYDYMLRDTTHAKKYYEMALASSKTSENTKEEIRYRLKYLHLSLDEMIGMRMKEL